MPSLSGFFIRRPNFAIVLSIVTTLAGLLALAAIPVAQYPNISSPQVTVTIIYPGASAQTLVDTVAQPIEEQVNGVPDMVYMQSTSSSSGTYTLTVTFALDSDPNIDQVNVQNRVQLAQALLPSEVQQEGIAVRTAASNFVLAVNLYSPDNRFDQIFISNYTYMHLQQQIARTPGVGLTNIFGERLYAMRIWLDPVRLTALGLNASDVTSAIQAQNIQVAAGQIGQPPVASAQQQQLTVISPGRLSSVTQFENIIVRTNQDGGVVRIRDVGRVELGAQQYTTSSALDNYPSATLAVYQTPNANALAVANSVEQQMQELSKQFPPGLQYAIVYNATNFVRANITEILQTLAITLVLVVAVVFLFLQDWRATLIPTVAIPVSLIGAFAALYALGFSANTVDLFAIVLAITLVVDDAIVVVENVTRHLERDPTRPIEEVTEQAMGEITGPVIATTLILVAVFTPVGFISGITGALYRQFAVTISVSLVISAVNALTLSPALCTLLLRPRQEGLRWSPFDWFNRGFSAARRYYGRLVDALTNRILLASLGIVAAFGLSYLLLAAIPSAFLPDEDQGYFFIDVRTPNGAAIERTEAVLEQIGTLVRRTPGVAHVIQLGGTSLISGGQASNFATVIAIMQPWAQRSSDQSVAQTMTRLRPVLNAIPAAEISSFSPPAVPGISAAGGINFVLQARSGQSVQQLASAARALIFAANQDPNLSGVFTGFSAAMPQILVRVDITRAALLGVTPASVYETLQANLGSAFVNNFNYQGFVFQVIVQAQSQFRQKISDINRLYVRSSAGAMVPLHGVVNVSTIQGADAITLYNLYPAVLINGSSRTGKSSGQAMTAFAQLADDLPPGFGFDWTAMSYQERQAAGQEPLAFLFAVVFSFLFLVALYESWTLPFSVMLPVAFASLGGLVALLLRRFALDVYGQIGLVLLIGLAAKNAILIVEFAKDRLDRGVDVRAAAEQAAEIRYRPVMMTALAFIVGVIPLLIASGAGAVARQSIGTTVFGGMVLASFVGVLFVPVLFVALELGAQRALRAIRGVHGRESHRQ